MKKHILVILALFLILSVAASAHSGRTDSQGGHHSSSGGYHYHHGYPAHQHTGGVCPYDYDDKTGENSGSSSGDSWVVSTDPGASDRFFYHDGLPAHQHVAGLCPYDYIGGSSKPSNESDSEKPSIGEIIAKAFVVVVHLLVFGPWLLWFFCGLLPRAFGLIKDLFRRRK